MNVTEELVDIAKDLILADPDRLLTADEVELFCPDCAEKIRQKKWKGLRASIIIQAQEDALIDEIVRTAKKPWSKLPKGWTRKSLVKFWKTLTGNAEHKVTECMKKLKPHFDDVGAVCGSLADRIYMTTMWRSKKWLETHTPKIKE